jgi:hypothetical protein
MSPVLVTKFLFINSVVLARKHKRNPSPSPLYLQEGGRAAVNGSATRGKAVAVFSRAACGTVENSHRTLNIIIEECTEIVCSL